MKKAITCLSLCVVAALSMVGCSNLSVNSVNDSQGQAVGNSTVHFNLDFNDAESLAKSSAIGDSLTITERKALLAYRKARITEIKIQLFKIEKINDNPSGMKPDYIIILPVVSGVCSGYAKIDSGNYFIDCYDNGKIKAGPDSIYTFDFQAQLAVSVGQTDTTNLNLSLIKNSYFPAVIYLTTDKGAALNGTLDSVYMQGVIGSGSSYPKVTNGYVEALNIIPTKKNFYFFLDGKKYAGLFDVTKIIDNNVIEVVVSEITQKTVSTHISFADDDAFAIINKSVKAGDTIPSGNQTITIDFNHQIADLSEMPNFDFHVEEVATGITININTTGTLVAANGMGYSDNQISLGVPLKPHTQYICRVMKAVDEYGNVLPEGAVWYFVTGN